MHPGHYLNHLSEPYRTIQHGLYYQTQPQNRKSPERHPFVNDRQETRRDTRDHKDGYPDKLNKPYKNLEDTHHLQKGLDHYLDQLTEPYNTYQNYHRLRETHEGVPPSQPKNEENPRNYLDLKTEDNEKYQRRRRATRRRPTTLLYQRKDSHLFQEPHGETKTEDNSHRRRQKRNDQGVRRPRDRGTLGHHLDNDLYLNTELYYTTKDYLNYPRRRHSKRRQKRNDQRARRPGDQDDLHKNYDLGDLIQGYQRRRTQRRQRHTTRTGAKRTARLQQWSRTARKPKQSRGTRQQCSGGQRWENHQQEKQT